MWDEETETECVSDIVRLTAWKASDTYGVLYNDLMQEVKHSAPGARLSARLRTALERLSPDDRRLLCSRTRDGCAPLFIACRRGNLEAVEYLVHVCNADLEQRGVFEVPDERSVHCVTALWCAAVAGHLPVLRALADAGAKLDAGSDSGSTPVRSACFMTHLDIVKFLVERGADIHRPNHNGGTCLINSVQSLRLCTYLIDHGAEVDATDMQHKTALHYAIQEHRLETARLLLARGADPRLTSRAGDDALRTAALKGASQVVALLAARVRYGPSRLADAYELLGATQLDEFNDVSACLAAWRRATALRHATGQYVPKVPEQVNKYQQKVLEEGATQTDEFNYVSACLAAWRRATALRHATGQYVPKVPEQVNKYQQKVLEEVCVYELLGATQTDEFNDVSACLAAWRRATALRHATGQYVPKVPEQEPRKALLYMREWRTLAELEACAADADTLRIQALLVCCRVLGKEHKEHVFRLMYRGASYADSFRYQRCIDLWTWALEIRLEKDSILYPDTCHTACALTRLLLDARGALPAQPHEDVVHIAELLMNALPEAREWLVPRPVFKKQADTFDRALRCLAHLLHLVLETAATDEERARVHRRMRRVVELQLRSAHTCDTLLHLSVSRLTVIRSSYCGEEAGALFPSASLAKSLLAAGADPLRRNTARCTALHVAALPYNFSSALVDALLAGGAHLDQPNKFGDSARELLALNADSDVRPLRHVTLACLAARALCRHKPGLALDSPIIPRHLVQFLDLHRP
ncbi:protein fem-1 homolog A-A-like [Cydia strobilella]|uniref:protein fem-1 homolog A-A-like n=1 Tax=Cydia strobilella TaxID=1100964 RepID=UPI0030048107